MKQKNAIRFDEPLRRDLSSLGNKKRSHLTQTGRFLSYFNYISDSLTTNHNMLNMQAKFSQAFLEHPPQDQKEILAEAKPL